MAIKDKSDANVNEAKMAKSNKKPVNGSNQAKRKRKEHGATINSQKSNVEKNNNSTITIIPINKRTIFLFNLY